MDGNRSSVNAVGSPDSFDELQQQGRILGHAVVGPGSEL